MSRQTDVVRCFCGPGQTISLTSTSAAAAVAFPDSTKAVRCVATVDCWVEIAVTPTAAATTSTYLPAGVVEYFDCMAGGKVAGIRASSDGSLYVRPTN